MSSIIWDKMDSGLQSLYVNFLKLEENEWKKGIWRHPALVDGPQKIFLTLHYTNALSEIEVLGFETDFKKPENAADGLVDLSKLKEIIDHPNVLKLFYGSEMEPFLETSAAEIEARKKNGADSTFVWTVNQTTGAFTGNTGKGVIVGIIDTGIDWKHDAFLENTGIKTRILSIWDQGLTPQGSESSPPANMLSGGNTTYGVEYKKTAIDKVLDGTNPQTTIRTKDCSGHGTHVAATAAGNGRQAALNNSPRFEFTGIAPEADIVVVKLLHLAKNPSGVSALKRFKDAISFINKMGDDSNKPVVINCSFGHDVGPHDGLSEEMDGQEVFLEQTFANVAKKICVFAAGNAAGKKTHAVISLPASGEVEIPLELYDKRIFKERFDKCSYESNTRAID
ncbi:MAG: S8 family serine peptidase, partial [Bacteroidota bacterium]